MGSMEISNAHHHQAMGGSTLPLEEVLASCPKPQQQERKVVRPQPEQSLKCPRCESTNTKFCYYNNYSLSQPRYFCKGCRRYWTKGGSLRNVPVGGGCRKNKRSSSNSSSNSSSTSPSNSSSSSRRPSQDHHQTHLMITTSSMITPSLSTIFPPHQLSYDPSDLSLAFARLHKQPAAAPGELGLAHHEHDPSFLLLANPNPNPNSSPSCMIPPYSGPGFLDILRGGFLDTISPNPHPHPNGFNSLFYGLGGNNGNGLQEVEGVGGGEKEEVVVPLNGGLMGAGAAAAAATTTATTVTTSQLEPCRALDHGGESKNILMGGLQWQLGGDGNMAVDSAGRDFWNVNGLASSSSSTSCTSWHGIINSSLM